MKPDRTEELLFHDVYLIFAASSDLLLLYVCIIIHFIRSLFFIFKSVSSLRLNLFFCLFSL